MAKQSTLTKSISTIGHFTRNNLERMGSMIDSVNAKTSKPRQYKAVNLGDDDYQQDLFREQTLKTTQQLLGTRFATYGKYAKKVVPNSLFDSVVDSAFVKVAQLAANWSQIDLPSEHRFADIATLDSEQRYALATDIANQNRALATLGGLTGLAGLPGLLADTLWLLLVSLRTVYQLAAVYDKPLTGKQGIKMAYELLANADLSKMQEKQSLLAGIGVGKGLLDNVQSRGLHSELKNLGFKNTNVNFYAEQVDSIASQIGIDLDQINLSWIRRFLPVTAVAVGMRYNSNLIDEVIGVAQATFAPEPKLANRAITDDSSNEAEVEVEKTEEDHQDKSSASKSEKNKSENKDEKGSNKVKGANEADSDKANTNKPTTKQTDTKKSSTDKKAEKSADTGATDKEKEKSEEKSKKATDSEHKVAAKK
ncbi:EcsC family protein [Psychrobacter frigidicola]|uniref:EcsC family protein n=1 Tax=Psychrobacter frigidicola TaxID=45611 RepID=UPI00191862A4|nr:EcsC family protein [Psychrobacter frigidicola]